MLMLLFHINNQRYAIPSQQVVEVIPLVNLTTLPHTPEYFAGVFNYRGRIIPVIDLCQLISNKSCADHLSTRIILVNHWGRDATQETVPQIMGLKAQRVVETLQKSDIDLVDVDIQIDKPPYLGKMIIDEQGMIQCVHIEYLLSEVQQAYLVAEVHRE
ncbi:chemotaxis protein CheW [Sphaerospermopsis aphanizomenoides BCCUSP55]|uniref:chemotaxis protein CheW n=1 Tax=Sphaerospermopsis aphanizomenoides TaxID=459663 RepID=UPI00190840D2|nr:chemotaxis protein CheW [Sphaerospermopsis aphanizomenoides]MBK1987938.1 chemotaxis protein CheW [Sphaerospermopsis aphanizomenoides BCCUSP55]